MSKKNKPIIKPCHHLFLKPNQIIHSQLLTHFVISTEKVENKDIEFIQVVREASLIIKFPDHYLCLCPHRRHLDDIDIPIVTYSNSHNIVNKDSWNKLCRVISDVSIIETIGYVHIAPINISSEYLSIPKIFFSDLKNMIHAQNDSGRHFYRTFETFLPSHLFNHLRQLSFKESQNLLKDHYDDTIIATDLNEVCDFFCSFSKKYTYPWGVYFLAECGIPFKTIHYYANQHNLVLYSS